MHPDRLLSLHGYKQACLIQALGYLFPTEKQFIFALLKASLLDMSMGITAISI
jgi:hypothetical protein